MLRGTCREFLSLTRHHFYLLYFILLLRSICYWSQTGKALGRFPAMEEIVPSAGLYIFLVLLGLNQMRVQKGIFLCLRQLGITCVCSWASISTVEIAVSPNKFSDLGPWSGAAPGAELPAVLSRLQAAVPGSCLTKPSLLCQHVPSSGVIPHAHSPARCKRASWQCACRSESLCLHKWHCGFPGKDFKLVANCGNSSFSSSCI